ncbi:hypothetical protein FB45DRAFT_496574 [Roridomyces roridus]|uniref:Uncharacterized protein n=1 Tax=Roridomyces roridus TaxID=1738132 RepID=A0AAD7FQF0_9AGAR|nr:hypothetical protein FB45DRAFT_496574 [Roridomyces roridus]
MSDLALTGTLEWVRAAAHRSFSPQPHLTLLYSSMVTYYHPRLVSLHADRAGRAMNSHRINNISLEDAMSIVQEVEQVVVRLRGWGSNIWGGIATDIVEYWSDRVLQLEAYLLNASDANTNATAAIPAIRTLAYSLLNPYMQPGSTPNASAWDLFFGNPMQFDNMTALDRCTFQMTGFLSQMQMTPQEQLLQRSIETVLARLCHDVRLSSHPVRTLNLL